MILGLIDEALRAGARLTPACETIGLTAKTIQRWRRQGGGSDRRAAPAPRAGQQALRGRAPRGA